jgi:hypothetical protein
MKKILFVALVLFSQISNNAHACGCCGPLRQCLIEVAGIMGLESAQVSAAASEVSMLAKDLTSLSQAIQVGIQAEISQINIANQQIVGAIKARSSEITTKLETVAVANEKTFTALANRQERLAKTTLTAEENIDNANTMGADNVPVTMRKLYGFQSLKTEGNKPDTLNGEAIEDGIEITLPALMEIVDKRSVTFIDKINSDALIQNTKVLTNSFLASEEIKNFSAPLIPTEQSDLYAYAAYTLMSGARIRNVQDGIEKGNAFSFKAQELRSAVSVVAEFLAWDMALRSEILTEEGSTSPLLFIKQSAFSPSDVYEEIEGIGNAGKAELLRILSAYKGINNIITYLMLEQEQHTKKMNAVEVGIRTREFNTTYSVIESLKP